MTIEWANLTAGQQRVLVWLIGWGICWFIFLIIKIKQAKEIKEIDLYTVSLTWVFGAFWPLLLLGIVIYFFFKLLIKFLWKILHQNEALRRDLEEYKGGNHGSKTNTV